MTTVELVISEAQRLLKEDAFDAGHDFNHHQRVVDNCLMIIEQEGLSLDIDALLIAAWWHDYKRDETEDNDRILSGVMTKHGFDREFIAKVLATKNTHSYGNNQESDEEKVLFDADKLEYVSVSRFETVSMAVNDGHMSLETQRKYLTLFLERISQIPGMLHFETSKRKFQQDVRTLAEHVKTDPLWAEIAYGLEDML